MSATIDKLRDWGCDIAGAMERMDGDEEFYIECLRDVAEDRYFELLGEALEAGEVDKAFDSAHALMSKDTAQNRIRLHSQRVREERISR